MSPSCAPLALIPPTLLSVLIVGIPLSYSQSVFYGNRSACYACLEDHDLVVADCTSALDLNSNYPKVLMRRCQSFEATEKYDEALAGE
jgi:hypothetical protein